MESATGGAAGPRGATRTSQPRHPGRGPQTRRLSAGDRQKRSALPSARAVGRADTKSCLRSRTFEPSGDPPAVLRQLGDWAEEFLLPMPLTVCIEARRKTLTHTSWTGLPPASRKWMSGQAAALAPTQDRTPFANLSATRPLRDPTLPSVRRPPSPLDFNLSWMSPSIMDLSFRPLRPSGIPWLQWRWRQYAGEGARATCFPRVPVETLAPPVLREKPLERKHSPEYLSAWLSPFLYRSI